MNNSSPRMALKLVDPPTPTALRAFCARCGSPPPARTAGSDAWRESRVCARCGLGLVLHTPLHVPSGSPFLIVDRALRVSALSQGAAMLMGTSEQQAVGLSFDRLLRPAERTEALTASLRDALLGGGRLQATRCYVGADEQRSVDARVGPCGPPPGALVILEPASS